MNFGSNDYILTESHPERGLCGLVIDRDQYLKVPHFDRALFDILNEHNEHYYYAGAEVSNGDKKSRYLVIDSEAIGKLLHDFGLYSYAYFVTKELAKGNKASLQIGEGQSIVFSLIKSN